MGGGFLESWRWGRMIRRHIDFHLTIGSNEVKASCGGREACAEVQLSQLESGMENLTRALQDDPDRQEIGDDLGERLYDAVFVGPVRELVETVLPRRGAKEGLRLRLRLDRKYSGWLWELFHNRGSFLAMSVKTPVVRDLEGKPFSVLRTAWPIRVLVVVSSPKGYPSLNADCEVADIKKALGWREPLGLVKVEQLKPSTRTALKTRIDQGGFHVLHFIGHGTLQHGQGALVFEDSEGKADPVDGKTLAGLLVDDESLRLIVLNACHSAALGSVSERLAQRGFPAVVGMQYPVFDDMALAFSRRFYGALARTRPVDWAVARGRQEMLAAGKGLDWAIPALFMSSSDGRLFRWKPSWGMLAALLMIPVMILGYWRWRSEVSVPETVPFPAYARACPPVEGLEMEFVRIPAGSFPMGSEGGEKDERPLHRVVISQTFCLGIHEVTQKQWEAVMGANSVKSKLRGDDLPVTSVSWDEAQEFVKRVNDTSGRKAVRLPTEAEWEYSARGPAGGIPASFNCLHDQAEELAPVRSLRPNRWGLYQMQGNVWEWVQDWYGSYPQGTVKDPQGPVSGEERVKRGGGYDSSPRHCRPAKRNKAEPGSRRYDVGFRVLRELTPLEAPGIR
ncbi:MAG TPA: SUMF1/EgtB/PvdO family nonheme iron enzyme [Thermoanaerobaculia bacterium]|nr:SUMF1/EgtB/PvdO family nonheme iron enzyme [Thermoanaerobaculia bacterium]